MDKSPAGEAGPNGANDSRVAVFIDYENVLKLFRDHVVPRGQVDWELALKRVRRHGSSIICKAYADWSGNEAVRKRIKQLGIEAVTVPSNRAGKNGVDVKIAVDVIDMTVLKYPDIRTVVLVSGDGDFTSLVNYLKDHGKYLVGIGIRGSAAGFLVHACHEYHYLENDEQAPDPIKTHPLLQKESPEAVPETRTHSDAVVDKYLKALRRNGIEISPNEYRPLVVREAYALLKDRDWLTFLQSRDKLKERFNHCPEGSLMHVLDAFYHIRDASCLEWALSCGRYPADTPLHLRDCRLQRMVGSADELLRKVDAYLLSVIAAAAKPDPVDTAAAARILYGRKANAELAAHISDLLRGLPAPPPPA